MCLEDLRMGRKKYTAHRYVLLPGLTVGALCGPAKNRTHLTIAPAQNQFTMAPSDIAPTLAEGWAIDSFGHPAELDIETHGQIVTYGWTASNVTAANLSILVIETFYDDKGQ